MEEFGCKVRTLFQNYN